MKILENILMRFRDDRRSKQICEIIETHTLETPARLHLTGLIGSQESFVFAGLSLYIPRNYLFIALDKEEAAYFQNDLNNLLSREAHFFPDSFKRPTFFEELNKNNVLLRTETISRFLNPHSAGEIIVTYPEALFEQVVAPQVLAKNQIKIQINTPLDTDFLIETLVTYGFERTEFVHEPGQFSIRGGIIDIYSFGNDLPYRIELFDTDVESIRLFDPNSQLSIQKLAQINIVPNINTQFQRNEKTSLLHILPKNTVVWVHSFEGVLDRIQACFEKAMDFAERLVIENNATTTEVAEIIQDRAFVLPKDIIHDIKQLPIIEIGSSHYFDEGSTMITYSALPQKSFNKKFDLLIKDLRENDRQRFQNFIFTDNPRQVERFYQIFEDLKADVRFQPITKAIHAGFIDNDLKIACYTDHQIFDRYHRYKLKQGYTKGQALNLRILRELSPGDYVTHIDHGVGTYSGLEKLEINGTIQEVVRLVYKDNALLYVGINSLHKISKYVGKEGATPKVHKLGSDTWQNIKSRTKKQVKDIAKELILLYAKRKASQGFAFSPDGYLQNELEASFIYEDTPDQETATAEVKKDMERSYPMDRLICGDVGFGKTEVAIRAAFKAVTDGKQVAVLVPTTILALQHFKTFSERLGEFGATVDYLNRFKTAKEKKETLHKTEIGKVDILIGTHAILSKELKFKDLGLLIIDEEQKFGVTAKEKLRALKVNVDTLTLTATPIPRTLQFSLMAARDLSVINTPPPNRQPIQTELRVFKDDWIVEAIEFEVSRGGQVFFLHNRVQSLPDMAALLQRLCPTIDIAVAHGQLPPDQLEKTLIGFVEHRYDVLVCTNIIETGLDISNANTIIINNAHHFGLSDLHQLRGRVGRSARQAFCYLLSPPLSGLPPDSRRRLKTLEEYSDLGSGLNIAMRDLDIRGAGNILGGEQSGFITDMGYETYQKILEEAVQELKETDFKDVFEPIPEEKRTFVRDVQIELDAEMHIPDHYVNSVAERLSLYTELDKIEQESDIQAFAKRLQDRFGKIPPSVFVLFDGLRLRRLCKELGFERLQLKNGKLRCFFVTNPASPYYDSSTFQKMMKYPALVGDRFLSFKPVGNALTLVRENVKTVKNALELLEEMKRLVKV